MREQMNMRADRELWRLLAMAARKLGTHANSQTIRAALRAVVGSKACLTCGQEIPKHTGGTTDGK